MDVREVVRVIFSGMAAFVAVDLLLLPWLVEQGVSFPAYLYLGVGATAVLSVGIGLVLRPRPVVSAADAEPDERLHPASR